VKTKELIHVRQEAEKAVADMEDGELKPKAFEIVLSHLLHGTVSGETTSNLQSTSHKDDRPTKKVSRSTNSKTGRILVLKDENYFRELRAISEVKDELASRGWHYPLSALSGPLQELVQRRELRRQKMQHGKKRVWKYSNP
jgi:hypothetical protein